MTYKSLEARLLAVVLIISFVAFFFISIPYYSGDVGNHVIWGRSILVEGSKGFYERQFHDFSFPNYPPVSMLAFAKSVWFYDFIRNGILFLDSYQVFPSVLVRWIDSENVLISFLKIPAILPFILSGLVVYNFSKLFGRNAKSSIFFTAIFLLNPSFIYLAVIWGQNDFTQVLFILIAIYFFLRNLYFWSYIFAALSILSKQTALVIWGLFLISIYKTKGIRKTFPAVFTSVILLWVFYIPFNNSNLIWPFSFYIETLRSTGLLVSDNSINYWGLFSRFRPADAQEIIWGLKLEYWGFVFFTITFIPVLVKFLKGKFSYKTFIYFLYLTSILYFFTLTRMHERYLIFGVVFAHILTIIDKKYWFNLLFFSLLLLINLYRGLYLPKIPIIEGLVNSIVLLDALGLAYFVICAVNYYHFIYTLKDEKV